MNCIICGNNMVNDICDKCGYQSYKKGIIKKFFGREKANNFVIDRINEFLRFYESIKNLSFYINRKYYQTTLDNYLETYNLIKNLNDINTLNTFSNANEYSLNNLKRFLDLYENFYTKIVILNDKYIATKLDEEKEYLDNILKNIDPFITLDDEQRRAVITDEDYNLIIAGAGAGKTTTMAAKVKYLIDKEGIDEKDILVVSFTNKAVNELKQKIKSLGIDPIVCTFHSIGNAIIAKENTERKKIMRSKERYWIIMKYLKEEVLKDLETLKKLIMFFGCYMDIPNELLNFNSLEQYYSYISKGDYSTLKSNLGEFNRAVINQRTKQNLTINSEFLRSIQEVQIANFLYLHNIDYVYEKPYKHRIFGMRRSYTPDFYITQDGKEYYIEHFGVSENGKNSRYDDRELKQYLKSIRDKKNLHFEKGTNLICTYSSYNDGRDLLTHLKEELEKNGISLVRKNDKEVFDKIITLDKDKYFYKLAFLVQSFLGLYKTNGYTEKDFSMLRNKTNNPRSLLFLDLMQQIYLYYQNHLKKNNQVDFDDMINDASEILRNKENLRYTFKYIIVDEYQDISRQRYNLAKEISDLTGAKVVAVGDDWQSIFAFAGSDVTLFTKFCKIFGYGKELQITKTYRNAQEVIDIAGGFVQRNTYQIKKKLISNKHIKQPIVLYGYDSSGKVGKVLENKAEAINDTIERILRTRENKDNPINNHKILILGRYNFDAERLGQTEYLEYNKESNKLFSKNFPNANLTFLTIHSSKGLGYDDVIIVNADNAIYGFPAQIEDDPILKLVNPEEEDFDFAEERRLFYVALTRTKNRVYIMVPNDRPSRFIIELKNDYENVLCFGKEISEEVKDVRKLRLTCPICSYPIQIRKDPNFGSNIYICMNEPELCNFVTNNMNCGKKGIHFCDKCDGYMMVKWNKDRSRYFFGCSNYNSGCPSTENIEV